MPISGRSRTRSLSLSHRRRAISPACNWAIFVSCVALGGAMADVYLAEQGSLQRQVAVKVLKSRLAER